MRLSVRLALPALLLASPLYAQDIAPRADSIMRDFESKGFSGVVRLAKNGKVVFEKGYGLANREEKIPFTPNTIVQIGSNTKDFTAVSILQLKERGLISLDDKISKYFPSAPPDKQNITIAQLMKHTAGFPLGLGGDFDTRTRDQLIDAAMNFKLLFEPGARNSYSNTGFALLAAIIEIVSGKTYDEYVRDNILKPLGLTHTGFHLPGFSSRDLAHGYDRTGADKGTMLSKPHAPDGPYWNLRGNGGMLSTAADMHAFYTAVFTTNRLMKPETAKERFDPNQPAGLAGSDLVNFFLYERDPRSGVEMIIASTNQNMKAPEVRRALAPVLGLPSLDGGGGGGPGAGLARAQGKPVSEGAAAVIREFIDLVNKGDKAALTAFVNTHFVPNDVSSEARAARLAETHENLGSLSILQMTIVGDAVQVVVKSEKEGQALFILGMEPAAPYKITRIGLQVGG